VTRRTLLYATSSIFVIRGIVAIFSGVAILWGFIVGPTFWRDASIERVADRIIAGDLFKPEILAKQIGVIDRIVNSNFSQPRAIRASVIIELRMIETSNPAKAPDNERLNSLQTIIRRSLSCAPADSFLWLVLYQLESITSGSKSEYLGFLRMSYQLGPNEGWIGLKRNPITFALPDPIPADLLEDATKEFVGLVEMGSYQEAADIIGGPANRFKQQLLRRLSTVDEDRRRSFATILYPKLDDVVVPGIERQNSHH
jgi:hypothetical protein